MKCDLVLGGVGGQGVLSIAWVIDQAAHAAGLQVKQSEVHGMAQRGGAVSACVRLSDQPVASDLIAAGSAAVVAAVEPLEALRPAVLFPVMIATCITPISLLITAVRLAASFSILSGRDFRYPLIGKWLENFLKNDINSSP